MNLEDLLADSSKGSKAKVAEISQALLEGRLDPDAFRAVASGQSGVAKGTCIEGLESATREKPDLVDGRLFNFLFVSLGDEEPHVKWESARVIGNVAARFPDDLAPAVAALLANADHEGKVVRWATAGALEAIVRSGGDLGRELGPVLRRLHDEEEDSGAKKKYASALELIG